MGLKWAKRACKRATVDLQLINENEEISELV